MAGKLVLSRRGALALGVGGIAVAARPSWAWQAPAAEADRIVAAFMSEFEIPGIGVAIVRPGQPVFTRGFGVRTLGRPERVDENTLCAIASNSKSFVAASLAMLVEEGKLGWDEPVVKYMPDFQMSDPAVTRMMTVRDLLVHRSGLALGAGDLMFFPESDHKRAEFLQGLRHLPLARGFRSGYAYDNILYVIAGILVQRVSGMEWEDFVTARLLRPLGMPTAVADRSRLRTGNVVGRHARLGPPARGLGKLEVVQADESSAGSPAGGIQASVRDIVPWLQLQLGKGELPGGRGFWSKDQTTEMWTPQVITQSTHGPAADRPTRPVIQGYALGWFVQDYRGHRLINHSGGLSGQITYTALLPEQGIGLAVFSNTEDGVVSGLRNALLDHLLGVSGFDWIAATRQNLNQNREEVLKVAGQGDFVAPPGGPTLPLAGYAGRYRDPWYGDIVISQRRGGLHVDFTRTPVFKSMLEPFGPDAFRTRFAKGAGEDAVVMFTVKDGQVAGVKMKALSPLADFSYDFHDLVLTRVP
jgi:CubicO group peptidase (beta-lactamase class C family)